MGKKDFGFLREIIEEWSSEEDLRFEATALCKLLALFDLSGTSAFVILEKPDKDICVLGTREGISYQALMSFLVDLFIEDPHLHEEIFYAIIEIKKSNMADNPSLKDLH